MMPAKQSPGGQAGASRMQAIVRRLPRNDAEVAADLQRRLSGFALALDAVLPDLAYLQHVVELAARGGPMPGDCPQRLYRIALRLFDLRAVLEERR